MRLLLVIVLAVMGLALAIWLSDVETLLGGLGSRGVSEDPRIVKPELPSAKEPRLPEPSPRTRTTSQNAADRDQSRVDFHLLQPIEDGLGATQWRALPRLSVEQDEVGRHVSVDAALALLAVAGRDIPLQILGIEDGCVPQMIKIHAGSITTE